MLVTSPAEAVSAADRIGYPVVLKAVSAELTHKSEAGAVVLDAQPHPPHRDVFSKAHARGKSLRPADFPASSARRRYGGGKGLRRAKGAAR